jgi:hypothetical protein
MSEKQKSVFETLSAINVNDKVEKKNGLTYLSWAWAWGEVKKVYPDATYQVLRDPNTAKPYFYDESLGYIVMTTATIQGQTLEMWLPVMDGANKAMKTQPYSYQGVKWENGRKTIIEKTCEAADMFDINKTLMRCLVKNLAMFGLGHYIFAGEDLPESDEAPQRTPAAPINKIPPVAKPPVAQPKAEPQASVVEDTKPQLKKGTESWDKVVKWLGENKGKNMDDIEKILKQRFLIAPAALKELKSIVDTNG